MFTSTLDVIVVVRTSYFIYAFRSVDTFHRIKYISFLKFDVSCLLNPNLIFTVLEFQKEFAFKITFASSNTSVKEKILKYKTTYTGSQGLGLNIIYLPLPSAFISTHSNWLPFIRDIGKVDMFRSKLLAQIVNETSRPHKGRN